MHGFKNNHINYRDMQGSQAQVMDFVGQAEAYVHPAVDFESDCSIFA